MVAVILVVVVVVAVVSMSLLIFARLTQSPKAPHYEGWPPLNTIGVLRYLRAPQVGCSDQHLLLRWQSGFSDTLSLRLNNK